MSNLDATKPDAPAKKPLAIRMRRIALRWSILYCVMAMLLFGCADKLILFPSRQPIRDSSAGHMDIAGPSGKLDICTTRSPGAIRAVPVAMVLAFVGNASRAEWDAEAVAAQWDLQPVEVWAVNYPGYGQSEGSARLASIGPSALAAFDAMKARANGRPIFVAGRSIGTTAALHVAAHRHVDGVILHSPPPLRQLIMGNFGWWNLWLAAIPVSLGVPSDLDSIENARHSTAPAIFIVTNADTLVPPAYQQQVIDAYAGPKQVIVMDGVDHNDAIPKNEMEKVRQCLDGLLK